MEDGDFFNHNDDRLAELVGFLEEWWKNRKLPQRYGLCTSLRIALPEMEEWLHNRRPPFSPYDIERDPSLRELLEKLAGRSIEVLAEMPDLRDSVLITLSDLIQVQWADVRDFLVQWWNAHDDDERTWLRVHIRRTVTGFDAGKA